MDPLPTPCEMGESLVHFWNVPGELMAGSLYARESVSPPFGFEETNFEWELAVKRDQGGRFLYLRRCDEDDDDARVCWQVTVFANMCGEMPLVTPSCFSSFKSGESVACCPILSCMWRGQSLKNGFTVVLRLFF